MKFYLRMKSSFWFHSKGMGTLESACIMLVMIPVITFFAAQVERYQTYSAVSAALERVALDQQIDDQAVEVIGGKYFSDLIGQKNSELISAIENIPQVKEGQYRLNISLISLNINEQTGLSEGTYTLLGSLSSGSYSAGKINFTETIDRIIKSYQTSGVQLLATNINSIGLLGSTQKYYSSALAMLINLSWLPANKLSGTFEIADLNAPLSYTQLIPIRSRFNL